ncbi:hypothetical protein [Poseidonocella sp. HB161398]|uniref:hypothetical protein n=1 Tax=Poseidonocella sp. HB161398 TaxID=2320855 RepID=UPI0011096AA1|nr:hypothetical protein [Poseidonocella sp. HB161398]
MPERVDLRVLGALRLRDGVTGAAIRRRLRVGAPGLTLRQNRDGLHVIYGALGLEAHRTAFEAPPAAPAPGSLDFDLSIEDPDGIYLPARASLALPRGFDPEGGLRDLVIPVEIDLARSAGMLVPRNWAALAVMVRDQAGAPLRGALVELRPQGGGDRMSWGLTNAHGEAVLAVPGLPLMRVVENDPGTDEDDEIISAETPVELTAVADPARPWPVDPAVLAAGGPGLRTAGPQAMTLAPGRTDNAELSLDLG